MHATFLKNDSSLMNATFFKKCIRATFNVRNFLFQTFEKYLASFANFSSRDNRCLKKNASDDHLIFCFQKQELLLSLPFLSRVHLSTD